MCFLFCFVVLFLEAVRASSDLEHILFVWSFLPAPTGLFTTWLYLHLPLIFFLLDWRGVIMAHRNHGQNKNQTQIVINHNSTSIMLIVLEKHGRLALAAGAPPLPVCTAIRWSGTKCRLFNAGLKLDFRYYISSKGWDTILNLIKMRDCHAQITTQTS